MATPYFRRMSSSRRAAVKGAARWAVSSLRIVLPRHLLERTVVPPTASDPNDRSVGVVLEDTAISARVKAALQCGQSRTPDDAVDGQPMIRLKLHHRRKPNTGHQRVRAIAQLVQTLTNGGFFNRIQGQTPSRKTQARPRGAKPA